MARLLIAVLLVPSLWRGLAIDSAVLSPDGAGGDRRPLMRHHDKGAEASMVHLSPSGEMLKVQRAQGSKQHLSSTDFCSESFILGQANKNNCTDSSLHTLILREAECRAAASEANAQEGTSALPFTVDYDNKEKHPIGCFQDANSNIFFYNPNGNWPSSPQEGGGIPVCSRKRFLNGTTNSNGGCPTGYANIDDEDFCRSMAQCEGYCEESVFKVGEPAETNPVQDPPDPRPAWAANYNGMPKGCFIREEDGCVYYNVPQATDPTSPSGIPVCSITTWATS